MSFCMGDKVWVKDSLDAWIPAEVVDSGSGRGVNSGRIQLLIDSGKKVFATADELFPRDADEEEHGGVEDMTRLVFLNEPEVLYNLRRRYALHDIYVSHRVKFNGTDYYFLWMFKIMSLVESLGIWNKIEDVW
ncbi:hypothetical protein PIB30_017989 [Stylosanthes scabra]|uniref:Myosin N-terminal SH3-like domain-containing protein n=1 Tax=Stylosanthes scabra TaxID=79078 RepID=A0ABU6U745_9FABA|nr:hypothetical protein [Stylosanthes scabra]